MTKMVMKDKLIKSTLIQLIIVLTFSCTDADKSHSKVLDTIKSNISIAEQWKQDTSGCLKQRNKLLAESIIKRLKLINKGEDEFLQAFGNPNKRTKTNGDTILEYYFDAICDPKGKIIDSADYCLAKFTFKNHKLHSRSYLCR
jgi:hypothetical protein